MNAIIITIVSRVVALQQPCDKVVATIYITTVVSLSHIGSGDKPDYMRDEASGCICQKNEESLSALSEGQDWLEHVLKIVHRGQMILDLYGQHGKIMTYI